MRWRNGWAALAVGLGMVAAQAQVVRMVADATPSAAFGNQFDPSTSFFEILGRRPSDLSPAAYYSIGDNLTGQALQAANHGVAVMAQTLSALTSARLTLDYDAAASPTSSPVAGAATYLGLQFQLDLQSSTGDAYTLTQQAPALFVRDRTSANGFNASVSGAGYPPAALPGGPALAIVDAAPASFRVDLLALMTGAGCCDTLHLSAPGPLPVVLTSPEVFFPAYAGFALLAPRDRNLPPGSAALPTTLVLSDYTDNRIVSIVVRGAFGVTVDPADYASSAAFDAARSWIDASIGVVNLEASMVFEVSALSVSAVPEPTAGHLLALGLAGVAMVAWRRRAGMAPAACGLAATG